MKTVQETSLLLTEFNGPQLQKTVNRFSLRKNRCRFLCSIRNVQIHSVGKIQSFQYPGN